RHDRLRRQGRVPPRDRELAHAAGRRRPDRPDHPRARRLGPRSSGIDSAGMPEGERAAIGLVGVSKRFGGVSAVDDVSLEIAEGEFFSLLGPSGCGKTTTLRMVAGFELSDAGRIVMQGKDVTEVRANRRPVNMVFQQYALFPHMSVYDNVAFGLKVKRVPRG